MDLNEIFHLILHPRGESLKHFIEFYNLGVWLYAVLFLVIFCETGLVVTPFLPGDSLLFAVGVLASLGVISLPLVLILLIVAAVSGDALNYYLGYRAGPKIFTSETSRLFNKKYLLRAQEFYEKYGGKAIVLARFVPIVRTFAPFVAGIGKMEYRRFALYNVLGGVVWVTLCTVAGYLLARVQFVEDNLHLVTVVIVLISVIPIVVEYLIARRKKALQPVVAGQSVSSE